MKTFSNKKNPYWNPVVETLPFERLQELQLKKFKKILKWAYERSKFHRRLYQEAGLKPGDIKSFEDVAKVPKVEKAMMRDIQRKDPFPYGDALCVPLEPVGQRELLCISRIPGRTGSGGRNVGHTSSMHKVIEKQTESSCLSGTTSSSPSGQVIMPLKRSAVKSFRAECSTRRPGFSKSKNFGQRP
jgi:hypothetical protein